MVAATPGPQFEKDGAVMRWIALAFTVLVGTPSVGWAAFAANDLSCAIYAPQKPGVLARCAGPFSGPGGSITIELHGKAPNRVTTVRLEFAGNALPPQTIPVTAEPVIDLETVGVLFMDFNSDGVEDLAVMECLPEGTDVPYRYYLFSPSLGTFAPNARLTGKSKGECE